jgi:ParB family chromosome partitioning protein
VPAPRSIDRGQSSIVKLSGGARLGTIRRARNAVTISIDTKRDREFGQWLEEHAERLALEMHQRWLEDGSKLDKKASCDGS